MFFLSPWNWRELKLVSIHIITIQKLFFYNISKHSMNTYALGLDVCQCYGHQTRKWMWCDLKTMSNVFYRWKQKTLILLYGRVVRGMVFQGCWEVYFLFFYFWLGLLLCKLLWNGFGELVLVMEHDPSYLRDILYEQCEAQFWVGISAEVLGERRKVERRKNMKLVKQKDNRFLAVWNWFEIWL